MRISLEWPQGHACSFQVDDGAVGQRGDAGIQRPDQPGGDAAAAAFDLTQPAISHHLKVLREAEIVDCERLGTWAYYWLVPAALGRTSYLLSLPSS
jgi:DNA-binding transcriptional ArsR family regulator